MSDLTAADVLWYVEQANPREPQQSRDIGITVRYAVATRTLTYSEHGTISGASISSLRAIGEA